MELKSISLDGFRNYKCESFNFGSNVNIISGSNAQGKTNLLEAIYFISCGHSFRGSRKRDMICFDKQKCVVSANAVSRQRDFTINAVITQSSTPFFSINGVKCKRSAQLSDVIKTVLFKPEDLELVKSGAVQRRDFLNNALCQLRPRYEKALSLYNKFLESKQRILRNGQENPKLYEALDAFSDGLSANGAVIIKKRIDFCRILQEKAAELHSDISGGLEKLSVMYKTTDNITEGLDENDIREILSEKMNEMKQREIYAGQCLCGPHRDDIEILINGISARSFASQGQARTAALSIKLAEGNMFLLDTGEYPIMLLDDVLSELDAKRQDFVLNHINGGQIFITCCEEEKLKSVFGGEIFHIENGRRN